MERSRSRPLDLISFRPRTTAVILSVLVCAAHLLAAMAEPTTTPTTAPASSACDDTDDGATDRSDLDCDHYTREKENDWNSGWGNWCGNYDDEDFSSNAMCCACDGGISMPTRQPTTFNPTSNFTNCLDTNHGAVDSSSDACSVYATFKAFCGYYDDDDFFALEMCCDCGGGALALHLDVGNATMLARALDAIASKARVDISITQDIEMEAQIKLTAMTPVMIVSATQRATFKANAATRFFDLEDGASLSLSALTFSGGRAFLNDGNGPGGGSFRVIGSTLVMTACVLQDSYSYSAGAVFVSGGTFGGTFFASDCVFRNTSAERWAGAVFVGDGGSAVFDSCSFESNDLHNPRVWNNDNGDSDELGRIVYTEGPSTFSNCSFRSPAAPASETVSIFHSSEPPTLNRLVLDTCTFDENVTIFVEYAISGVVRNPRGLGNATWAGATSYNRLLYRFLEQSTVPTIMRCNDDAADQEYCPREYCAARAVGFDCYCLVDYEWLDPADGDAWYCAGSCGEGLYLEVI